MSHVNKLVVSKAKEILKELGYEVKTSHVYELLSRLSNEKSWNVAKSKNVDFLKTLSNLKEEDGSVEFPAYTLKDFEKDLTLGIFKNKIYLGNRLDGSLNIHDPFFNPHALFVGAMGAGKSFAMRLALTTWLITNGANSMAFILDQYTGGFDYNSLFKFDDHIIPILDSEEKIRFIIDSVYEELTKRREEFLRTGSGDVFSYEKITGKSLTRILLVMTHFHSIPYQVLNFDKDYKTPGTVAYKFHQIMRTGRMMGVFVMAETQKATKSDIPPEIIPNFTHKQVFRVSRMEAAYLLGEIKAAEIPSDQKGRCETDYGSILFPLIEENDLFLLMNKYLKPLKSDCLVLTKEMIKTKQ